MISNKEYNRDLKIKGCLTNRSNAVISILTSIFLVGFIFFSLTGVASAGIVYPGESIQNAIDNLPESGGIVTLSPGLHEVSETINIDKPNIILEGINKKNTTLVMTSPNTILIRVNGGEVSQYYIPSPNVLVDMNLTIQNIKMVGYGDHPGNNGGFRGVDGRNCLNVIIQDCWFENFWRPIVMVGTKEYGNNQYIQYITIKNNIIKDCGGEGMYFSWTKDITVTGNDLTGSTQCTEGIALNSANLNSVVRDNIIKNAGNRGIFVYSDTDDSIIINNTILGDGVTNDGILLCGARRAQIEDNVITGCGDAIHFEPIYSNADVTVKNNIMYSNDYGIYGDYDNRERVESTTIESNTITQNTYDGIFSPFEYETFNVKNNIIANNGGYGINSINNVIVVSYNDVWNNALGNYNGISAGTGDISADPLFINPAAGNFYLSVEPEISPAIDSGSPLSDYSNEPSPNGGRINMGAFGNTHEASKSTTDVFDFFPIASAGSDHSTSTGDTIFFDGSASTDDNGIVSYEWDFDASDGLQQDAAGVMVQHVYDTAGIYTVTLTVTDTNGYTDSDTATTTIISSENPYPPKDSQTSSMYDNRLREGSPDNILAENVYLDVGHIEGVGSYRDVLWFDLSDYNDTDTINSAALSLFWYYESNTRNEDTVVEIYRPLDWNPSEVSWNDRDAYTTWNNPGGDWFDKNNIPQGSVPYASLTFSAADVPDNRYYNFDITELVQDYVSGKYENTGFFLKVRDENNNYIAFRSSDWSNPDQIPKLTIEHSTSSTGSTTGDGGDLQLNKAPVLSPIGAQTVDENSELAISLSATDADGDSITYSVTTLPTGATFDSITGVFEWTPSSGQAGAYTFTFEATDGYLTDSEEVTINVNGNSDQETLSTPIYISTASEKVSPGETFTIDISIDPSVPITGAQFDLLFNGQMATVDSITEGNLFTQNGADTLFSGGTTDNTAGTITNVYDSILGTSSVSSPGTMATISMTAGSTTGIAEFDLSNVIIGDTNSNAIPFDTNRAIVLIDTAPVLNSIVSKAVDETDTLTFTVGGSDPDGDSLTYSATGLPSGASFDPATCVFTWTPVDGQAGTYVITFEVTDGHLTDSEAVTIAVNQMNNAPVIDSFEPADSTIFNEGEIITIGASASDMDGQALNYLIKIDGVVYSTSSSYVWNTDYSSAGAHIVEVVVSDGMDQAIEQHTIHVNDVHPRWDVNKDGKVDILDITIISQKYGSTTSKPHPRYDVNQDGVINIQDLVLTGYYFGETVE